MLSAWRPLHAVAPWLAQARAWVHFQVYPVADRIYSGVIVAIWPTMCGLHQHSGSRPRATGRRSTRQHSARRLLHWDDPVNIRFRCAHPKATKCL